MTNEKVLVSKTGRQNRLKMTQNSHSMTTAALARFINSATVVNADINTANSSFYYYRGASGCIPFHFRANGIRYFQPVQCTFQIFSYSLNKQSYPEAKLSRNEQWIDQVRALVRQLEQSEVLAQHSEQPSEQHSKQHSEMEADVEASSPLAKEEITEGKEDKEAIDMSVPSSQWQKHAGFSVYFDFSTDSLGERAWQTRVSHHETGEKAELPGIATSSWVNWILERARLPITESDVPAKVEPVVSSENELHDIQLEIVKVQVSETKPSDILTNKNRKLLVEVCFRISGTGTEAVMSNQMPFQLLVHTVNSRTQELNTIYSEQRNLQQGEFEYLIQYEFPMLMPGIYEFHSTVFLLPPYPRMACHRGSTLIVKP